MVDIAPLEEGKPWAHKTFLSDGRTRICERYSRHFRNLTIRSDTKLVIIPDALVYRMYFPCLQQLLGDKETSHSIHWILLESAAEYLDYRNQNADSDGSGKEPSAPQERQLLQGFSKDADKNLSIFCDLSFREDDDEWIRFRYEDMNMEDRTRNSLLRAAQMVENSVDNAKILILSDQELDSEIELCSFVEFSHLLERENILTTDKALQLRELCESCKQLYLQRKMLQNKQGSQYETMTHMSPELVETGIQSGELCQGRLIVTKENVREAYVTVGAKMYFIDIQEGHHNRAFHNDIVAIRPSPEEEWGRPIGRRRLTHNNDDPTNEGSVELDVPTFPSARVVSIVHPGRRSFVATLTEIPKSEENHALFVPMDIRIPRIRVATKHNYTSKRTIVQIDKWEEGTSLPTGHCSEIVGPIGDVETEIAALLHETEISLGPFSLAARDCLPPEGDTWKVPESETAKRLDLRKTRRIFSVDPPGCQDIDDSMHAQRLPNGDIEIGVHIADVTQFVEQDSQLDVEAQAKGTTVYLVDRRFDMLPSVLSSNLCSLHAKVDRLALSVIWVFSNDFAQIKSTWYGRTVIHNIAAMTYDQADNILSDRQVDNPNTPLPPPLTAGYPVDEHLLPELKTDLQILTQLARKLRTDRETIGGAVDLSFGDLGSELKFSLKSGIPTEITTKEDKEIHHTIAELMILGNTSVAEKIHTSFPDEALLRIHQSSEEERFRELAELVAAANIPFNGRSNRELAESLKMVEDYGSAFVQSLLKSLVTRAMSEAKYVSSETKSGSGLSHFGLGLQKYTHFTSPIRRYADIIVHRQLLASLEDSVQGLGTSRGKDLPFHLPSSNVMSVLNSTATDIHVDFEAPSGGSGDTKPSLREIPYQGIEVDRICENLNLRNRLAKFASMECQRLFLNLFFKQHVAVEKAVVTKVRSNGLVCYVPKYDLTAPLFLLNKHGILEIDPEILGLGPVGADRSKPTTTSPKQVVPFGQVSLTGQLSNSANVCLKVSAEGSRTISFSPLDEVLVNISTTNWDTRARIPSPTLELVSDKISKPSCLPDTASKHAHHQTVERLERLPGSSSLFKLLMSARTTLDSGEERTHVNKNTVGVNAESALTGRVVFREFCNPDTLSAARLVSQEVAAAQAAERRAIASQNYAKMSQYDDERRLQSMATSRQQKLASEKRSSRHSGKKN